MSGSRPERVLDPVCGMTVNVADAEEGGLTTGRTVCTLSAPALAPRPSFSSPGVGRRRRRSVGSRPPWHADNFGKRVSALLSATARLGLGRLIVQFSPSELPAPYRDEANASAATAKDMAAFIDEYAVAGRSASEAGALTTLGGKPLIVLTAELGNSPGWMPHQDAMATLSTNSRHDVVPGSTHQSLTDNPAHAAVVSGAIVDVVEAIRTGLPLASH